MTPPPKPREWWALLLDGSWSLPVFTDEESAKRAAKTFGRSELVHVREVAPKKKAAKRR